MMVYPRRPFNAERVEGDQSRPAGWSTLIRRTWHSDEEFRTEFVSAVAFETLLAAVELWNITHYEMPGDTPGVFDAADAAARALHDAIGMFHVELTP